MTVHSLIEYLQSFSPEAAPSVTVIGVNRRLKYPIRDAICITDQGYPAIILDVGEPKDFDREDDAS